MLSKKTLYVFVDESGNFDFSNTGTSHFVMSAIFSSKPLGPASKCIQLKYTWLAKGVNVPFFHASENLQKVRDEFFNLIARQRGIRARTYWVSKEKVQPEFQNARIVYFTLAMRLAEQIIGFTTGYRYKNVVVLFDKALNPKEESTFKAGIKPILRRTGIPTQMYFHRALTEPMSQIADYVAWANYVKLEKQELRPYKALSRELQVASEITSVYVK